MKRVLSQFTILELKSRKDNKMKRIFGIIIIFGLLCVNAQCQIVNKSLISSGGDDIVGFGFSNFCVLGETFVQNKLSGGNFELFSGLLSFCSVYTGVVGDNNNIKISIFPNPTRGTLYLRFSNHHLTKNKIQLYNANGHKMVELENNTVIDVSNFPIGLYLLRIVNEKNRLVHVEKIVKI